MNQKSYALLSVSDKKQIVELGRALVEAGVSLLSTGGTYRVLEEAGIPVMPVDTYTGFPEMMDGRVKTLHPKVHGGLLANRANEDHLKALESQNINRIDYLVVNLYPFKETIERDEASFADAIENIDIGGPSMLRSGAKNFESVTVLTDPSDYQSFINQLKDQGQTTLAFRKYLAGKVFQQTAYYDSLISQYLSQDKEGVDFENHDWDFRTQAFQEKKALRYGENSHQEAVIYSEFGAGQTTITQAQQVHGKDMSYNNYKDASTALDIVLEFDQPAAVGVKHMNPCGVGIGQDLNQAFDRAYLADSMSIFGGIVALNRPVDKELAEKLSKIFLEIIIAPSFEEEALSILTKKKNIRLLRVDMESSRPSEEVVSISGGLLVQDKDNSSELAKKNPTEMPKDWQLMTEKKPSSQEIEAMNFLMKVVKHVKSNAIVVGDDKMTYGVGAGQMNRVGAAEIALKQAKANPDLEMSPFVMASDAFLPMKDTVELAAKYGIQAIIQPGGSKRDQDSVDLCEEKGISMVATGIRHFRH